jgi:hypothetical protein
LWRSIVSGSDNVNHRGTATAREKEQKGLLAMA